MLPTSLDEAVGIAKRDNPQLLMSKLMLDQISHQVDQVKAGYYPTFDAYGDVKRKENDAGTPGLRVDNELGVKFTWLAYQGGATLATERATLANLQKSKYDLFDAGRTVEESVRRAWQTLLTSRDVASINKENARLAGRYLELARQDKKMGGQTTLLEILLNEVNYATARAEAVSAEIDTLTSAYNLMNSMGRLNVEMFQ